MTNLINEQLKNGYFLRQLSHNHPDNTPYPSGLFENNFGDILFAKKISSLFRNQIKFEIFIPESRKYVPFGPNSTFEDFENVIPLINRLNEIIVTPK
ncbi:MAG: hypothetical protein IJ328_06520 [Muribaculaceae bacterium]|nr:hypothetical protein [Muribaculaceae bacterium]